MHHLHRAQIKHQEYLAKARALGVSEETATAEVQAVQQEAQTAWATVDVYAVAWRRLTEGPTNRPTDQLRDVARRMTAQFNGSNQPEAIDAMARQVGLLLVDRAPRTLADQMADMTAPDEWRPDDR